MKRSAKIFVVLMLVIASIASLGFISRNGGEVPMAVACNIYGTCPAPAGTYCSTENPVYQYTAEVCTGTDCRILVDVTDCDTGDAVTVSTPPNYSVDCAKTGYIGCGYHGVGL